jgi:hypothetical protein
MLRTIQAYRLAGLTRRGIYVVGEVAPDLSLPGQLPAYHLPFPGEIEAVNLPRSRYLQVSNEAPAVKDGAATERSEAPLTGGGSAVARLPIGSGLAPLPSR